MAVFRNVDIHADDAYYGMRYQIIGLTGAVIGHLIMGFDVTMMSLFGMVALTGIVVNDALILVDFINKEVDAGKALGEGLWQLHTHDLRAFGIGKHRNVDDTPAGGGAGMVLRADVVGPAIEAAQAAAVLAAIRPPVPIQTIIATLRSISAQAMAVQITTTTTALIRLITSTRRSMMRSGTSAANRGTKVQR